MQNLRLGEIVSRSVDSKTTKSEEWEKKREKNEREIKETEEQELFEEMTPLFS